jgi:predicted ATPase
MMSSQPSEPELLTRFKNLLLTGPPGCGKTTVLERVAGHLGDLRLAGFLTVELREHGQRIGFEAVGLGGRGVPSWPTFGSALTFPSVVMAWSRIASCP